MIGVASDQRGPRFGEGLTPSVDCPNLSVTMSRRSRRPHNRGVLTRRIVATLAALRTWQTIDQLTGRLDLTARTVYRLLVDLQAAGVRVERGTRGGRTVYRLSRSSGRKGGAWALDRRHDGHATD